MTNRPAPAHAPAPGRPGTALCGGRCRQAGAALLAAMLTVTLVATLAATAMWQQWRGVEVEAAERSRVQSAWILTGALDWARLILREDARAGGADHLAEPWSVPLHEARLSTFLAMDQQVTHEERDAFLSGQITDLQSRLNLTNLAEDDPATQPALASFTRLFDLLNLPLEDLMLLESGLRDTRPGPGGEAPRLLAPQRLEQLSWLGLAPRTLAALAPYVTLLPVVTPVNLNTASAEVLHASVPGLDVAEARALVTARGRQHFRSLDDVSQHIDAGPLKATQHSVASRFFEARAQLRLDQAMVLERSLLQRDGLEVRTLWRDRGAATAPATSVDAGRPLQ